MNIHRNIEDLPKFTNPVITIGSFDGVHLGHQAIFQQLKRLASKHNGESVVVTFDPHPRSVIFPGDHSLELITITDEKVEEIRKTGVDHLVIVPFTVEFSQLYPEEYIEKFLIEKFQPSCIVIGYDHRFGRNREGDVNLLRSYGTSHGFEVVEIKKQTVEEISISSTKIRNAVKAGEIQKANQLLGHPYSISGRVVHGNKLGTQIGFPTANIEFNRGKKLLPPEGVYAAYAEYEGKIYEGMLYFGKKPSIRGNTAPSLEIHLFDFHENIYGEQITLRFVKFLREDEKYEDLHALRHQLRVDKTNAEKALLEMAGSSNRTPAQVAIVILNYKGQHHMEKYLPDLIQYSPDAEIWVADNGSGTDELREIQARFPSIHTLDLGENYGFAEGYNQALEAIHAEYFLLLNNDVRVTQGWLAPLIARIESSPSIAAVQPKIRSDRAQEFFEYAGAAGGHLDQWGYPFCRGRIFDHVERDLGQYESSAPIFWASGAAMLIRSEIFLRSGGFDKDYFAHQEEIDLCWRIRRAGFELYYEPKSVVYHYGGGTLSYVSPHKSYLNFRNNLTTLLKNEPMARLLWLLPLRWGLDIVAALKYLVEGKPRLSGSIFRAQLYILKNWSRIMKKRQWTAQRVRQVRGLSHSRSNVGRIRYKGSILFQFFFRKKKSYSQLVTT